MATPLHPPAVSSAHAPNPAPLPVSVLIPVFNRAASLTQALNSVAAQRRAAAEVIVIDDGSTDDSAAVASHLGARVVAHEVNRGQVAARNTGIAAAVQPWIAFLDSDDEWLPGHLQHLWELRRGMLFVACSAIHCRPGPRHDRLVGPLSTQPVLVREPWRLIHPHNFVTMSSAMVRRDALLKLGGFRAHDGVVEDLDMWVRLLERGPARVSPTVTVVYHVHGGRITDDLPRTRAAHVSLATAYAGRGGWPRSLVARNRGAQAWDELRDALDQRRWGPALRQALQIAGSPAQLRGVLELLAWRGRGRRASGRVRRDGEPSIAILVAPRQRVDVPADLTACERADLRELGRGRTLLRLVRRPAGVSVVHSTVGSGIVRLLGIRAIRLGPQCTRPDACSGRDAR